MLNPSASDFVSATELSSMETEKRKCVWCDKDVEGEVEGIPVTLCCAVCCKGIASTYSDVYKGRYRTSKTQARETYGCTVEDLKQLKCKLSENPVTPTGRPMRLYLKAEAKYLGSMRRQKEHGQGEKEHGQGEKEHRGALFQKKTMLEACLGISLAEMDEVLRHFLIGDYLSRIDSKTQLDDIRARYSVLDEVTKILDCCPEAHPEAAFTFCQTYPSGTPADFQELKEKVQCMFQLEGARIFHQLPHSRFNDELLKTGLKKDYQDFLNRDSDKIIRRQLECWCTSQTVDEIMSHPACQHRLNIRDEEKSVAKELLEFWNDKDDKEKRTRKLKAAFDRKGVSWPSHCVLCDDYINGNFDCNPEEIVGINDACEQLRRRNIDANSTENYTLNDQFRMCFYNVKMGYKESVRVAVGEEATAREMAGQSWFFHEELMETDSNEKHEDLMEIDINEQDVL